MEQIQGGLADLFLYDLVVTQTLPKILAFLQGFTHVFTHPSAKPKSSKSDKDKGVPEQKGKGVVFVDSTSLSISISISNASICIRSFPQSASDSSSTSLLQPCLGERIRIQHKSHMHTVASVMSSLILPYNTDYHYIHCNPSGGLDPWTQDILPTEDKT